MTMFKKKNTVKSAMKKDGGNVTKKTDTTNNEYFKSDARPDIPKGEIHIRLHEDGLSVVGNTTNQQLTEFLAGGLFRALDCMMNECGFTHTRKLLLAMKWTLDIEKFTNSLLEWDDEDDSDDD